MTNILLKLRKKIPNNILEILKSVFAVSAQFEIKSFIIGATARDLIFEYVYEANIRRKTEDIDFGIAVGSWGEYAHLKKALIETGKFEDDPKNEQRIWWKSGGEEMKIDLVPFGGVETPPGQIAFPPKGNSVMSTLGFAEAYENAWFLELTEDFTVRNASLAGLAMLKFVAYNDRPQERRRDLQDIWFIARNYMKTKIDGRLFDENASDADLLDDDFNYETCGARLLGRDIAQLLNIETRKIISKILEEEDGGGSLQKFADVISSDELHDEDRYNVILETLRELRKGINERT